MDLKNLQSINSEIAEKVVKGEISAIDDPNSRKLAELVEFAQQFNDNIVITESDFEKISKKYRYSKDIIEELKVNYIDNIRNNVQKALARNLAQYSLYVEDNMVKDLKEMTSELDLDNPIRKENEEIIRKFDNYLTKLHNEFNNSDDIKTFIKITLLNSPFNPFKDFGDIETFERPIDITTLEQQMKLTEAEVKKTIEREKEKELQREHQGAQISGPSL